MQWLWTVIGAVLCVLALVVLFFPFIFRIDFEAGLKGLEARLFLFKKQLYKYEKYFSDDKKNVSEPDDFDDRVDNDDDVVPSYVPPKKKAEPVAESNVESVAQAPEPVKEKMGAPKTESVSVPEPVLDPVIKSDDDTPEKKKLQESKAGFIEKEKEAETKIPAKESKRETAEKAKTETAETPKTEEVKEEKRSLTDTEFWTILLTPEFDETAFWAVKKWLLCLLLLFRVRFKDCFVEGIRADVMTMGYGAALNGIIKGYPYVCDWDIRMDWTRDHELRAAGQVVATVNICRVVGLLIATLFYGGIIAYKFWRRRAYVLKTNELPELGWIRKKIVKLMAEE